MRIRNWEKFQHYKDRSPQWIKLHRDVLDNYDLNTLEPGAFKFVVQLWLVAAEYANDGALPSAKQIAFRLRMEEKQVVKYLEQIASTMLAECYQPASKMLSLEEKRREENNICANAQTWFETFWKEYPKKKDRSKAEKAWKKLKLTQEQFDQVMLALKAQKLSADWNRDNGQFIPHPGTWLNGKRWEDETPPSCEAPPQVEAKVGEAVFID